MPNYQGSKVITTLIQINVVTGIPTGLTKPNTVGDPDYIAPAIDNDACKPYSTTWEGDTYHCEQTT